MPPANSPAALSPSNPASPHASTSHQRPLTPLSYLSSPVPDLAATLHTVTADAADEANVNFLRSSLESLDQTGGPAGQSTVQARPHLTEHQRDPQRTSGRSTPSDGGSRQTWAPRAPPQTLTDNLEDLSHHREHLLRVLETLNRIHDPYSSSTSAYGNRTPSPRRQSLYDWAPSHEDGASQDREHSNVMAELRRLQDLPPWYLLEHSQREFLRRQQLERDTNGTPTHDRANWADTRDRHMRDRERRRRENESMSLRSRAVLQRARQGGSPSATERILRYVMERERSGLSEEEERARGTGWLRSMTGRGASEDHRSSVPNSYPRDGWPLPPPAGESRTRTTSDRSEYPRRQYHPTEQTIPRIPRIPRISTPTVPSSPSTSTSPTPFLENAFKYLGDLRASHRYEDALSAAIDHGLATKEFFADKHDDFVMDLEELTPLPATSWLQPGTMFDGHQHALNNGHGLLHTSGSSSSLTQSVEQINPHYRGNGASSVGSDHPPGSTRIFPFVPPYDPARPWLSYQFQHPSATAMSQSHDTAHDHWPVRVIIHAIDPEKMILQGTMEAYDVPQQPNQARIRSSPDRSRTSKKSEPITTYLEGHIIDLTTHSFITPGAAELKKRGPYSTSAANSTPYTTLSTAISFPSANAQTDASNWRKLPPFNSLSTDDEAARCILSKARMDEIRQSYVFMRWKERCFVHSKDDKCTEPDRHGDHDRGHGLTISGFYYISMRRSDGLVEGLYFDPSSTLYQHLRLRGRVDGWPAVEFR